jgi:hypothetical protein
MSLWFSKSERAYVDVEGVGEVPFRSCFNDDVICSFLPHACPAQRATRTCTTTFCSPVLIFARKQEQCQR